MRGDEAGQARRDRPLAGATSTRATGSLPSSSSAPAAPHAPLYCLACATRLGGASSELRCRCGARYPITAEGVVQLVSPEFLDRLTPFTAAVATFRTTRGVGQLDPTWLPRLPEAREKRADPAWQQRRADLRVVRGLLRWRLPQRPLRVLEVGAWNHWLTAHLAAAGHQVVGVDTFSDAIDGLGARRWHRAPIWRSVQLDTRDLRPLGRDWDLVVVNRCVQFMPDPIAWLAQLPELVAPGGRVLMLGLAFFERPRGKQRQLAALASDFRGATGHELFLAPCKGWLRRADAQRMAQLGVELMPYPDLRLLGADLRARLAPSRPTHRWGWWRAGGRSAP